MTGQALAAFGKTCPAAVACIPLDMTPTVPRLRYLEGWIAEYWYYPSDYRDQSVNAPVYYMALELPSGNPVCFTQLRRKSLCLGKAPEIITNEFYVQQNGYLEKCAELVEQSLVDAQALTSLEQEWLQVQPGPLRYWLSENKEKRMLNLIEDPQVSESMPAPENLVDYWKQEMARAIENKDFLAAKLAQQEMNKAAEMKRN